MPEVARTSRTLVQEGAELLSRSGIPDPRRQALRIWAELHQAPSAAVLLQDEDVDSGSAARYQDAVQRRAAGEPLAHVTGWSGFRHLTLLSDARALIPRPETEGLVDLLLARVPDGRVVDVGTGSACLALSLAVEGAYREVVGVDCSPDALALAGENCALFGRRVDLVRSDLCEALATAAFDALISNPPYLTTAEYATLDSSVRNWEPTVALESGADGLLATARLLDQGRRVLRPGGWLAIEVDCSRAQSAAARATDLGWQNVEIHLDLFGRERYLLARRSNTR
jgi:release factor glutamine methyltransferase